MKKLLSLFTAITLCFCAVTAQNVARVYGVRVYSEPAAPTALVSFSADNPADITEELDLSQFPIIRAGACDGTTYYLLVCDADGMLATGLWAVDLASKRISLVKAYDYQVDTPASIVAFDMAWNPADGMLYAIGMDLSSAVITENGIEADLGYIRIDPATGDGTTLGTQGIVAIQTIAFNDYGDLFGVADDGALWALDGRTGKPLEAMEDTGYIPAGLQSMTYDATAGAFYWAALTEAGGVGASTLVRIDMTEDWFFTVNDLGKIKDTTELVALYVDPNPISPLAPQAPADFTVVPAADGSRSATLSWTNPSLTRAGQPLSTLDITVYADGKPVATLMGRTPGADDTYTYAAAADATVDLSVAASTNGAEGEHAYANPVFVGTDRPGAVTALAASRPDPDKYDITVTWNAPATGAQGGWFDATQLTYRVVRRPDGKVITESTAATSVTDTDITATGAYIYDVTPSTAAGAGTTASTAPCISGPAITLPYTMDLTDEAQANLWTVVNGDNDQFLWSILRNWGGSDTSFRFYPETLVGGVEPTDDWLISPAFALEAGKHYAISYDVRLWGDLFPATYQVKLGQGLTPADLTATLEDNVGAITDLEWETRSIPFAVDHDGNYNIGFGVTLANPVEIKGVYVREIFDIDLAATGVTGTSGTGVGAPTTYTVTVENCGFNAVSDFTLALVDADGKTLASRTVNQEIPALTSAEVTIDWTPATAGTYAVSAKVTVSGDPNTANDLSPATEVLVLPAGKWHEITDGTTFTAFAPFCLRYKYSAAQTLYSAAEMGSAAARIEGIIYYYSLMTTTAPGPFSAKIALANTDATDFNSGSTLAPSDFTQVFDGTVTIDPAKKAVTLMFDEPFEYTGGSLCIFTQHASETTASVIFDALSPKDGNNVTTAYYSDTEPFDFTGYGALYRDRPNISLFLSETSGVEDITADTPVLTYDRATRTIRLDREATVSVYTLQGTLLLRATGTAIDASALSGPAIITTGAATIKVIL